MQSKTSYRVIKDNLFDRRLTIKVALLFHNQNFVVVLRIHVCSGFKVCSCLRTNCRQTFRCLKPLRYICGALHYVFIDDVLIGLALHKWPYTGIDKKAFSFFLKKNNESEKSIF